ncbi:tetratricopeptide repeat protein [Aquisediminimonas sediminicola]|uniref:tetratricopeptide repeat protein n=1 Tax=Alteraquisediminimonas sediminicola TaxID=2676787 RepID=UPI001C8D4680|nr:tetratricopeptide repeat protein [Aquisediminimonas sediminicola]
MALPPENNEAFLREVDEELRREQITGFWRRWRVAIIGGTVIGLATLGGWLYYQHSREQEAARHGQLLDDTLAAMSTGDMRNVEANLKTISASHVAAYRASAMMAQAAMAALQGKEKDAVAQYAAVTADEDLPPPFRDAAVIRQTALEYDAMPPQAVIDRLKPLAAPGNAWFGSAGEMTALAMLKLNQNAQAAAMFAAIANDKQAPASIRRRATQMAGSLGVDALGDMANDNQNMTADEKDKAE